MVKCYTVIYKVGDGANQTMWYYTVAENGEDLKQEITTFLQNKTPAQTVTVLAVNRVIL